MMPKILKTVFLALGLAMLWIGFLSNYRLNKQQIAVEDSTPAPNSRQLETYTLKNDSYSDDAVEELKFNNPGNGDHTLIYQLGDFPESEDDALEYINTAGFADEFNELEVGINAEDSNEPFPVLLIFGGVGFLLIGFLTLRKEVQKKQTF